MKNLLFKKDLNDYKGRDNPITAEDIREIASKIKEKCQDPNFPVSGEKTILAVFQNVRVFIDKLFHRGPLEQLRYVKEELVKELRKENVKAEYEPHQFDIIGGVALDFTLSSGKVMTMDVRYQHGLNDINLFKSSTNGGAIHQQILSVNFGIPLPF